MKVAILYDGHADGWSEADIQSVREVVECVADVLAATGHVVSRVPVKPGLEWIEGCRHVDLVFNLCEGIGGISRYERFVVGTLELIGVPFTGAGGRTIAVCHEKPLVNALLASVGVPVPEWTTAHHLDPGAFPLPAIVKPAAEDASVGIDQGAVVTTPAALHARVARIGENFDQLLIQRYVEGRELAVGFLGNTTLPLSEIDYGAMPAGTWPILTFDAKWVTDSPEEIGSRPICPAVVSDDLAARIRRVAGAAWRAVGGTGYGRVDLRVDPDGETWVIEVNPNPDISADAGFARMGRVAGLSYEDLVLRVAELPLHDPPHTVTAARSGSRPVPQSFAELR